MIKIIAPTSWPRPIQFSHRLVREHADSEYQYRIGEIICDDEEEDVFEWTDDDGFFWFVTICDGFLVSVDLIDVTDESGQYVRLISSARQRYQSLRDAGAIHDA